MKTRKKIFGGQSSLGGNPRGGQSSLGGNPHGTICVTYVITIMLDLYLFAVKNIDYWYSIYLYNMNFQDRNKIVYIPI